MQEPKIEEIKPVYEKPLVMELNKVQTGEGGVPISCQSGSANLFNCLTGAGFLD